MKESPFPTLADYYWFCALHVGPPLSQVHLSLWEHRWSDISEALYSVRQLYICMYVCDVRQKKLFPLSRGKISFYHYKLVT